MARNKNTVQEATAEVETEGEQPEVNTEVQANEQTEETVSPEAPAAEAPAEEEIVLITSVSEINESTALPDYSTSNREASAKVGSYILDAIMHYRNGKMHAHNAACLAVLWASVHGDARYITLMCDKIGGLAAEPTADGTNFRIWCGHVSKFTQADGKDSTWLGFNSKPTEKRPAGFYVKSGPEFNDARKAMNEVALRAGPRFMDRIAKPKPSTDLLKLLEMARDFKKKIDGKADKADLSVPSDIEELADKLAKLANVHIGSLSVVN